MLTSIIILLLMINPTSNELPKQNTIPWTLASIPLSNISQGGLAICSTHDLASLHRECVWCSDSPAGSNPTPRQEKKENINKCEYNQCKNKFFHNGIETTNTNQILMMKATTIGTFYERVQWLLLASSVCWASEVSVIASTSSISPM